MILYKDISVIPGLWYYSIDNKNLYLLYTHGTTIEIENIAAPDTWTVL